MIVNFTVSVHWCHFRWKGLWLNCIYPASVTCHCHFLVFENHIYGITKKNVCLSAEISISATKIGFLSGSNHKFEVNFPLVFDWQFQHLKLLICRLSLSFCPWFRNIKAYFLFLWWPVKDLPARWMCGESRGQYWVSGRWRESVLMSAGASVERRWVPQRFWYNSTVNTLKWKLNCTYLFSSWETWILSWCWMSSEWASRQVSRTILTEDLRQ